jgi:hypothetical protein
MIPMTFTCPVPFGRPLILAVLILSCVACAPKPVKEAEPPPPVQVVEEPKPVVVEPVPLDKAQQELGSGIESYENGSYKPATKQLQNALTLELKVPAEQARAHKYLAFMNCVGGRTAACRTEFRKALAADPSFDLTLAESGHPTWGPIFKKVKAEKPVENKTADKKTAKPAAK